MSYVHVTNGTVDETVGSLPGSGVRQDTGQSVSGLPVADSATQQACGWFPVTDTPRPADDATTTYDRSITDQAGVWTVTWTQRPKTQAEIDAATADANRATILSQAKTALTNNTTYLAIGTPTTAQAVAQVRALTQQMDKVIRLVINQLDGTS